jgi:hypothetical protein
MRYLYISGEDIFKLGTHAFPHIVPLFAYDRSSEPPGRIVALRVVASYASVRAIAEQRKVHLRTAAYLLAVQRVAEAAMTRGIYP